MRNQYLLLALCVPICLCSLVGCVNLAANLLYAIHGNTIPAEFEGLTEKRVAVVCGTESGLGTDPTSSMLCSYIEVALNNNVKDIEIVRQSEIQRWLDSIGRTDAAYEDIGAGVNAELVLAVEIMNLSLRNGATLYRGQADVTVSVYDIADGGKLIFTKEMPEFTFPKMGGPTITDTSEVKFRTLFLTIVARKVSALFYEVDATSDYALDATANSF